MDINDEIDMENLKYKVKELQEKNEELQVELDITKEQLILFGVGSSKDFKENARPLLKYLAENHHPHTTAIITSTSIELLESIKGEYKIYDYIQD